MKASPAGHAPVCPTISFFAVPDLLRIDTSNLSNTVSGTSESNFHLDGPSNDFPSLDNTIMVTMVGGLHIPRMVYTGNTG